MALAARGRRETPEGERAIDDEALVARLRAAARRIHVRAALVAVILTAVVLACPA